MCLAISWGFEPLLGVFRRDCLGWYFLQNKQGKNDLSFSHSQKASSYFNWCVPKNNIFILSYRLMKQTEVVPWLIILGFFYRGEFLYIKKQMSRILTLSLNQVNYSKPFVWQRIFCTKCILQSIKIAVDVAKDMVISSLSLSLKSDTWGSIWYM